MILVPELMATCWFDTICLYMNVVPLAISASFRAFFWAFGIPLCYWKGAKGKEWDAVAPFTIINKEGESFVSLPDLANCLIARRIQTFPHAGGRRFTEHITGVAAILSHWNQPDYICLSGLIHSGYSTEMFPWEIFFFSERRKLSLLVGETVENLVWVYCTVSQINVYREVRRCAECGFRIPMAGFPVSNCYTGQLGFLPPRLAADLLVLLAADLCEQDPFFDLYLVGACLKLAEPYLAAKPPLIVALTVS